MDNIEKKLMAAASGETRLKPDEQRQYIGTFRERVLLTIDKNMGNRDDVKTAFPKILEDLKAKHPVLKIKSCSNLTQTNQVIYMKMAQTAGISFTNVNEGGDHPFDLLIHTDQAVHQEETDIFKLYPQFFESDKEETTEKKGFWKNLFK
ncbi:DUF1694 domain-containing protein [Streptococcus downei]|uniref:Glycogen synthase n=1 Tax=Streptococcus downei MFe28 TaxID=764290 RepID=A0A380JGF5_STRDO|nr:DUF1694 domain-containing protein [Streptococcus downei]SUN36136.1 glycogen synthase [Streptococcus downei MFe28]